MQFYELQVNEWFCFTLRCISSYWIEVSEQSDEAIFELQQDVMIWTELQEELWKRLLCWIGLSRRQDRLESRCHLQI